MESLSSLLSWTHGNAAVQTLYTMDGIPLEIQPTIYGNQTRLTIHTHSSEHNGELRISIGVIVNQTIIHSWSQAVGTDHYMNIYYTQLGAVYEALAHANTMMSKLDILHSVTFIGILTVPTIELFSNHWPAPKQSNAPEDDH